MSRSFVILNEVCFSSRAYRVRVEQTPLLDRTRIESSPTKSFEQESPVRCSTRFESHLWVSHLCGGMICDTVQQIKKRITKKVLLAYPKDADIDIAVATMEEMNEMVNKLYQVVDSSDGSINNLLKDIFLIF